MISHQNIIREFDFLEFCEMGVNSVVDVKLQLDFFEELNICPF